MYWRSAKHELATEGHGRGMLDWSQIASHFRNAVALLEDYKFFVHRPTGLVMQQDVWDKTLPFSDDPELRTPPAMFTPAEFERGEPMWPNRIGYDTTMQSEAWQRGYFETMMGMARGSEMREGYMTFKGDRSAYAPQHVRSNENPYPVPLPPTSGKECPDISECWPSFESPYFHYKRILTTRGFTSRQRMDAGLAYASYLDHKGEHDHAGAMYRWSFDLAIHGLPPDVRPESVVDVATGVIMPNAPFLTPNIVTCSTAIARHFADTDRTNEALATYLSVLRGRRTAQSAPRSRQYPPQGPDLSLRNVDSIIQWLTSLPFHPEQPPLPPTGNEPFERKRSEECEEAALALYVAEILFAKMGRRSEGLSWARDATETSDTRMKDKLLDKKNAKVCEQCLNEGLKVWTGMLSVLAHEQKVANGSQRPQLTTGQELPKSESWFWRGLASMTSSASSADGLLKEQDWVSEERKVAKRLAQFEENLLNARLNAAIAGNSSWFVV